MVDIRIRRSIVAIPIPKTTVQAIVPVTANPSNSLKKKQKPATSTHQIPFYKIKKTASKADNRSRRSSVATPRPKTTVQASVPATANQATQNKSNKRVDISSNPYLKILYKKK